MPGQSDQKIAGTLSFDPVEGLSLELYDRFQGVTFANNNRLMIHGVIFENATAITLTNCLLTSLPVTLSSVSGYTLSSATFHVGLVFEGHHFSSEEEFEFENVQIKFSNLESWFTSTPVEFPPFDQSLKFGPKDSITFQLDDFNLSIYETHPQQNAIHSVHVKRDVRISIDFTYPVNFQTLSEKVFHLRRFFSFAVGVPVFALDINLGNRPRNVWVDLIILQIGNIKKAKTSVSNFEMVFTRESISNEIEDGLRNWFKTFNDLRSVYELYFAVVFAPSMYLDVQFLLLSQAIEAYHRKTFQQDTYMDSSEFDEKILPQLIQVINKINNLPSSYKDSMKGKLKYTNEYSLRKRLKDILNKLSAEYPNHLLALIPDRSKFVDDFVNNRNNLTHHDSTNFEGELYPYVLRSKVILQICLINLMRVPTDKAIAMIEKSSDFKLAIEQYHL